MAKVLGITSLICFASVLVLLIVINLLIHAGGIRIEDKTVGGLLLIPFGLTFVLALLANAVGGGKFRFLGQRMNRIDNPVIYWLGALIPIGLGLGTIYVGAYLLVTG